MMSLFKKNAPYKDDRRKILLIVLLTVIVMAIFLFWELKVWKLVVGEFSEVWKLTDRELAFIKFSLPRRWKKMVAVVIVSYCIGYSTVAFQTITNNRILTPGIMGLDSLYMFIQTIIVFFFGSGQLAMMTGYPNFFLSVGLMVGASWLLFLVMFRGENKNLYFLVLSGMIVGGLFNGLATFMQVLLDPNEFSVLEGKMFASFNNINADLLGVCLLVTIVLMILTIKDYRPLDVASLGAEQAVNLGVAYDRLVIKTLMITSVMIAVSTALVGPITFLGILVVSIARNLIKSYRHSYKVMATMLIGCFALAFGLLITERLFKFSTTLSVIINFIGGICFMYMILKEGKQ